MLAILAGLVVWALAEIYVFVQVGVAIGFGWAILALIGLAFVGVWLAKLEGIGLLARVRGQLQAGQAPTNEVVDGFLILMGGLLLIVPGFISDAFGLFLLFPPTRILVRGFVTKRFRVISVRNYNLPGRYPPDDVIDV